MQTSEDVRGRDDVLKLYDRFLWPYVHGNRDCACASERWVGMYASYWLPLIARREIRGRKYRYVGPDSQQVIRHKTTQ